MQITKVQLLGRYVVTLPFFGLRPSNRYILKGVDGLTPPEIDIFITKGTYQGRNVHNRQMIIRFGVNPNFAEGETVASIRQRLYGLLTPGADDSILVQLMNGPNVVAVTRGYISKFEAVPFSENPEVQITIDCNSPYLEAYDAIFETPSTKDYYQISTDGTVASGFYQEVIFSADMSSWTLFTDPAPHSSAKMRFEHNFQAGDMLQFCTIENYCFVRRVRNGNTLSIIKALTDDSVWLQLHPGVNDFYTSSQNFNWGQVIHTPLYWGI